MFTLDSIKNVIKAHDSQILIGVGIAGMAASVTFGVMNTPKAIQMIEKRKHELELSEYEKLPFIELVGAVWKSYLPSASLFVLSSVCIISGNRITLRKNAALATACRMTEETFHHYREKVIDSIGEKKEKKISDDVARDELNKNPASSSVMLITGMGQTPCYDPFNKRYFMTDIDRINKAINDINAIINEEGKVSLNAFYEAVGIDATDIGDILGWNRDWCRQVRLKPTSDFTDDGRPCYVIGFMQPPEQNF